MKLAEQAKLLTFGELDSDFIRETITRITNEILSAAKLGKSSIQVSFNHDDTRVRVAIYEFLLSEGFNFGTGIKNLGSNDIVYSVRW